MAQPQPPPSDSGADHVIPSGTSVGVSGSGNITLTNLRVERDLNITQTFQQAPKPKPTLPAHTPHNLPERTTSAERFVGRSLELEKLNGLLAKEGSRTYLTGMGGVGKSELTIQHAYNAFDVYRGGILRLDARQGLDAMALQVVTFFRGTFPDAVLPEDKSPTELLPLCWSQWPSGANPPEPVLLILDDQKGDTGGYAAERQLLEGLPSRFRRLITQRETAPATAQAIDLPLLKRSASLELLALQAGEGGTSRLQAEKQGADALCAEVGDLPLALVLLGARLAERPDLTLAQLLADLQAKGAAAKALRQAHPELGARLGVVEALLISWEPLNEPAKSLAFLLAVMAPALIPWGLVEACRLPEQEVEEGSAFGDQQAELLRSQFLVCFGPGLYQLHPLVRQFIRLQSKKQESVTDRWRIQFAKTTLLALKSMADRQVELFCDFSARGDSLPRSIHELVSNWTGDNFFLQVPSYLHQAKYVLTDNYELLSLVELFDLATITELSEQTIRMAKLIATIGAKDGGQASNPHRSPAAIPRHPQQAQSDIRVSSDFARKIELLESQDSICGYPLRLFDREFGIDHPVAAARILKFLSLLGSFTLLGDRGKGLYVKARHIIQHNYRQNTLDSSATDEVILDFLQGIGWDKSDSEKALEALRAAAE